VNPLQQLEALSGNPGAFTFVPANDPTGQAVPSSALSTSASSVTGNLARTSGPGSPTLDPTIDFTTVSGHGQLAPGSYTWTGYLFVPTTDTYTFDVQQSSSVPLANVTFSLDGVNQTLAPAANVYGPTVPGSPTNAGYTEPLLTNRQSATITLNAGTFHALTITFNNTTGGPASFRFAYSRVNGDIADAASAAVGKKLAIVFVNDGVGATSQIANPYGASPPTISSVVALSAASTNLIEAIAAANPNTVVVLDTANPVLTPWSDRVKGILEMWFAGQEGGTSTARVLLGQANPSGHTALTWPANATDTIWAYNQPTPLYPGDTTGPHFERLNGNGGCTGTGCPTATGTIETEGIYTGYRFFDKLGIAPRFPFGFGLSYTMFSFSNLRVARASDGGLDVTFAVTNTGSVAGADAVQVYVGPPARQPADVQFAVRSLVQFDRVELQPGQSQQERLHVAPKELSYWSDQQQRWVLDADGRRVFVGDADAPANLPLQATVAGSDQGNITCANQQLSAVQISGNLTVPSGAWCDLIDVTVTGNLQIHGGSGVRILNTRIQGNLQIDGTSDAADPLSAHANVVCDTTIGGNVQVIGSANNPWIISGCSTGMGNQIDGNLQFINNAASRNLIAGNTIRGNLQCQNNGSVTGGDNVVGGNLQGQCAGLGHRP
jgi:beta-glucosidase